MNIAIASDANYLQHTYVMLYSLLTNQKQPVTIHAFSSDYEENDRQTLKQLEKKFNVTFFFYKINRSCFKNAVITHHISIATYYRLVIADMLPQEIDKILYLDCDLIVMQDLDVLYQTNLNQKVAAAVAEPVFEDFNRLNLLPEQGYFNAGVMLINLKKWRALNLTETCLTYLSENSNKIVFWDQDVLNACLKNNWVKVEPKWNQQSALFEVSDEKLAKVYEKTELKSALKMPAIIHFTGSVKPWQLLNYHPYRKLYYYYLNHTPFNNGTKPEAGLINYAKRLLIYFITPNFKKKIGII